MKKIALTVGALFAFASPAFAISALPAPEHRSVIEQVRTDCAWVNNKWSYKKGEKFLACRPDRPSGKGWVWYKEGGHEGWYHKGRKEFHYKNW